MGPDPRFNQHLFNRIRRQTGSQAHWADLVGVTQTTIGNWERGYTVPNRYYRTRLRDAAVRTQNQIAKGLAHNKPHSTVDIVGTERSLRHSILRAALTDFDFDSDRNQIVPIPFAGDFVADSIDEITQDRTDLIKSLAEQARIICESVASGSNLNEAKFISFLQNYRAECAKDRPNPRLLNRLGAILSRMTNSEDVRGALNSWDSEAIDGFNRDHLELMRLYFKEALAKAQEVDGAQVKDVVSASDGAEFRNVAELMDEAKDPQGGKLIDPTIPTILRDIANEIRDLNDADIFTNDPSRKEVLRRRKSEAFKNGGVYVGRFVFFSALIASIALPGAEAVLAALGTIIGITEAISPGTIRSQYEILREKFPALPALPTTQADEQKKDREG
ncbi:helix-turn-helix domain-containing protein [Tabrizicola sp. M-4]|uniref:helix-turn-helix domain-containing protein n=1 Tax=Tabrizicola sp. M-4 TaxID=3055847 RepID=UPI003DA8DB76